MEILIKPLITEKVNRETDKYGKYGFIVDKNADKPSIKAAVEKMYGVTVETVNTIKYAGKTKTRYTKAGVISGKTKGYKKAIVSLKEGDVIDFYSNI